VRQYCRYFAPNGKTNVAAVKFDGLKRGIIFPNDTITRYTAAQCWTTGNEKGAAYYVSNLVSQKNGRFIEVWESDMLTKMFSDVRNPFAHGPGQSLMPTLSPEQTNWTIETAMTWIKSLVRRF